MTSIMHGVRVLEVADFIFVPAATSVLADWGAEVIKIEHHEYGDLQRTFAKLRPKSHVPNRTFNPLTDTANRGKRSIGINLGHPDGLNLVYELAKTADVFMTSKLTPTRQKLHFDVDDIRKHNPDIIYARATGQGVRGAEAESGAFDGTAFWYRSGMAYGTKLSETERISSQPASAVGDLTSAMNLVGGISAALYHRSRTGEALTVDVSLLGSALWSLGGGVSMAEAYQAPQVQLGLDEKVNPFMTYYRTADDRWIALYMLRPSRYWSDLCRVIERLDLADDDRFTSEDALQGNADEVVSVLRKEFATRPQAVWVERMMNFTGQWAPIQDSLSVANDPQVRANGYVNAAVSSTGEDFVTVQPPVQFNEELAHSGPAPRFNADRDEILDDLGLSAMAIARLRDAGAIA